MTDDADLFAGESLFPQSIVLPGFTADTRLMEAKAALRQAREAQAAGDLRAAWNAGQMALLLQQSYLAQGYADDDQVVADATALLEAVRTARVTALEKSDWKFARKLDVILRDTPLNNELFVNTFGVTLLPGSVEDVAALRLGQTPRLTWLDLRGMTKAQALDAILTPLNMGWQQGFAGSTRRLEGASPWVYQVGHIALPWSAGNNWEQRWLNSQQALAEFLHVTHLVIGQYGDHALPANSAVYLDQRRLLVFGTPETHAKITRMLEYLTDPNPAWAAPYNGLALSEEYGKELDALRARTLIRQNARGAKMTAAQQDAVTRKLARQLDTLPLQLYTDALAGKFDEETFTECRMAWEAVDVKSIPYQQRLRAAWLISEAAILLPDAEALMRLAGGAVRQVSMEKAFDRSPAHAERIRAMAGRLGINMIPREYNEPITNPDTIEARIAETFRIWKEKEDEVKALFTSGTLSGDQVLLALNAAREFGGDTWEIARLAVPDLCRGGRVPANMIVVCNRLAALPAVQ